MIVKFYHLTKNSLEEMLPRLMEKIYERGLRATVVIDTPEHVVVLDKALWTYTPLSFLPHGSEGNADDHPIWLTTKLENKNNAQVLVLTAHFNISDLKDEGYSHIFYVFDAKDDAAVISARKQWAYHKETGDTPAYYVQSATGQWIE